MREFLQVLSIGLSIVAIIMATVAILVPKATISRPDRRGIDHQRAPSGAEPGDSKAQRDPRRREGGSRGAWWSVKEPRDWW